MKIERIQNLTPSQRFIRISIGLGLSTSVLAVTGPLGWMTILPLVGIYPGVTGFTGYDPIVATIDEGVQRLSTGSAAHA